MKSDPAAFLPLSPVHLYILGSLAAEDLHGYGIMQEVAQQSGGTYKIGPGTLYDNLQRLMSQGLVEELESDGDSRRRYYRLSSTGKAVLTAEVARLEIIVRKVKGHLQPLKPRRA